MPARSSRRHFPQTDPHSFFGEQQSQLPSASLPELSPRGRAAKGTRNHSPPDPFSAPFTPGPNPVGKVRCPPGACRDRLPLSRTVGTHVIRKCHDLEASLSRCLSLGTS
ncbi:hypothetical protein MRX96_051170 [Rhipicephalus microplus]